MQIRVLLFATLRDAAGTSEVAIELPASATVSAIREPLLGQYPMLERYLPRIAYAVNRSYSTVEAELHEGDEVALIPPVSGG